MLLCIEVTRITIMRKIKISVFTLILPTLLFNSCHQKTLDENKLIHGFCIDFNWGEGGPNKFAQPGLWAEASPKDHIKWYKDLGVNTIQTFSVSCNGYAWYKNGVVPEQPGLKYDFLTDMVGKQTSLITCLAEWNEQDPKSIAPAAIKAGVGLYGFTKPNENSLLPSIDKYLSLPIDSFKGDDKNIATLARVYNGFSFDFVQEKK